MTALSTAIASVMTLEPTSDALRFEGRWWSWGDLLGVGYEIERAVRDAGLPADTPVGLVVQNRPAVAAALLAGLQRDRCTINFNALLPDVSLAASLVALCPRVVVGVGSDVDRDGVVEAARTIGALVVALPEVDPSEPCRVRIELGDLGNRGAFFADEGVAISMETSGTTGTPKRISIRCDDLWNVARNTLKHHGDSGGAFEAKLRPGIGVSFMHLGHIGPIGGLVSSVLSGRKTVMMRRFEPHAWAALIEETQSLTAGLPPATLKMILDAGIPKEPLRSLKAVNSGTAPLDPAVARAFEDSYGIPVLQAYGATEFSGGLTSLTLKDYRSYGEAIRGTVGRAHPGVELRVVDPAGDTELAVGTSGVLMVRTRHTVGASDQDWVRTNDLARIDANGFLFIDGRVDDVIIRGGFKVDTTEVERILREHPGVDDASVVGL